MRFSQREVSDLLISWIVLSVAFAIFIEGGLRNGPAPVLNMVKNPLSVLKMLIIVGSAFLLHELSHKYVAQEYGLWAEYRKWNWGLIMATLLSLTGYVLFATPGAVMIMSPGWSPEVEAKTSIAGPIANITVGIVALLAYAGYFSSFLVELASINFFLAVFNLLPIPPMDGSKVLKYNGMMWGVTFGLAAALLFVVFSISNML